MKIKCEKFIDSRGYRCYEIKTERREDFKKLLKLKDRVVSKYSDGYSDLGEISCSINDKEEYIKQNFFVIYKEELKEGDIDVTPEDLEWFIDRLREAKNEFDEKETRVYEI